MEACGHGRVRTKVMGHVLWDLLSPQRLCFSRDFGSGSRTADVLLVVVDRSILFKWLHSETEFMRTELRSEQRLWLYGRHVKKEHPRACSFTDRNDLSGACPASFTLR